MVCFQVVTNFLRVIDLDVKRMLSQSQKCKSFTPSEYFLKNWLNGENEYWEIEKVFEVR